MSFVRARVAIAFALFAAVASVDAAPAAYRLDPVHTQVWFRVAHLGFSRPLGRFAIDHGWFRFDPDHPADAAVDVTIDLGSVDLGDAKWDKTVRSAQFLDVERWPTARFYSTSVEASGKDSGTIHGQLSLHGETRPVDVEFKLNAIGTDPYAFKTKAGFSAHATIARADFGMTRYKDVVGATIELIIEAEGVRDDDAANPEKKKEPSNGDAE